jgi:hypothetical protein
MALVSANHNPHASWYKHFKEKFLYRQSLLRIVLWANEKFCGNFGNESVGPLFSVSSSATPLLSCVDQWWGRGCEGCELMSQGCEFLSQWSKGLEKCRGRGPAIRKQEEEVTVNVFVQLRIAGPLPRHFPKPFDHCDKNSHPCDISSHPSHPLPHH